MLGSIPKDDFSVVLLPRGEKVNIIPSDTVQVPDGSLNVMSPVFAREALTCVAVWPVCLMRVWRATSFQAWAAQITAAQSSLALVKFVVLLYNGYFDHISWMTDFFFLLLHCPIFVLLSVSNVVLECVVKMKQKNRQLLRCKEKNISNGEIHIWHSKILTLCVGPAPSGFTTVM